MSASEWLAAVAGRNRGARRDGAIGGDDALALVVFDAGAAIPHPRLDLDGVEPAAGHDQAGRRALLAVEKRASAPKTTRSISVSMLMPVSSSKDRWPCRETAGPIGASGGPQRSSLRGRQQTPPAWRCWAGTSARQARRPGQRRWSKTRRSRRTARFRVPRQAPPGKRPRSFGSLTSCCASCAHRRTERSVVPRGVYCSY